MYKSVCKSGNECKAFKNLNEQKFNIVIVQGAIKFSWVCVKKNYQCKNGMTSATQQIKIIWANMTMLCHEDTLVKRLVVRKFEMVKKTKMWKRRKKTAGANPVNTFPSSNKRKCMPRRQYHFFFYTLNISALKM